MILNVLLLSPMNVIVVHVGWPNTAETEKLFSTMTQDVT